MDLWKETSNANRPSNVEVWLSYNTEGILITRDRPIRNFLGPIQIFFSSALADDRYASTDSLEPTNVTMSQLKKRLTFIELSVNHAKDK